jgi:hypothetical protein
VITKLAQDPVVWFAVVLSTYCVLLAVGLRTERIAWNRNAYLLPETVDTSETSDVNALAEQRNLG